MIIWNIEQLANDLERGEVTEKQQFTYLLVLSIAGLLFTDPYITSFLYAPEKNQIDLYILALGIPLNIAGLFFCYSACNPENRSTGFIARFICLSLPVGIRVIILALLLGFVIGFAEPFLTDNFDPEKVSMESKPTDLVFNLVMIVALYWYMKNALLLSYNSEHTHE